MQQNQISSYQGEDFDFEEARTTSAIPFSDKKSIYRELLKLERFRYEDLIPPKKILKSLASLYDGIVLYALRPHAANKNQYRLPLVSLAKYEFLILGLFSRKDANFPKEIAIAEERYRRIKSGEAHGKLIDFNEKTWN